MNDTPHAPVRLSMPDINDAYSDGDRETRRRIVQQHDDYNLGLLHFLQTADAMPQAIREDARRRGFCRDEFQQTGGISPKLYIREARRLVGQHVFTGRDTRQRVGDARSILHENSIAMALPPLDSPKRNKSSASTTKPFPVTPRNSTDRWMRQLLASGKPFAQASAPQKPGRATGLCAPRDAEIQVRARRHLDFIKKLDHPPSCVTIKPTRGVSRFRGA